MHHHLCGLFCCLYCFQKGWNPEPHTFRKKPHCWAAPYFWVLLSCWGCFPASASQALAMTVHCPACCFKRKPSAYTAPDYHSSKSVIPQISTLSLSTLVNTFLALVNDKEAGGVSIYNNVYAWEREPWRKTNTKAKQQRLSDSSWPKRRGRYKESLLRFLRDVTLSSEQWMTLTFPT